MLFAGRIGVAAEGRFTTHVDPFQYSYFVRSSTALSGTRARYAVPPRPATAAAINGADCRAAVDSAVLRGVAERPCTAERTVVIGCATVSSALSATTTVLVLTDVSGTDADSVLEAGRELCDRRAIGRAAGSVSVDGSTTTDASRSGSCAGTSESAPSSFVGALLRKLFRLFLFLLLVGRLAGHVPAGLSAPRADHHT